MDSCFRRNDRQLGKVAHGVKAIDGYEAILSADEIYKVLNSTNPYTGKKEKLYIIKGLTYDNILIYTKGKIVGRLYILNIFKACHMKR